MPVKEPAEQPSEPVLGGLDVNLSFHEFSNIHLASTFTITNNGPASMDFLIAKVRHTEYKPEGPMPTTDNPLFWVAMGPVGDVQVQQSFQVRLDGGGGSVEIRIEQVTNSTMPRWEGTLLVSSPQLGSNRIDLSYSERPEGRWSGKMYVFANFPDDFLDDWITTYDRNPDEADIVSNAFIQQWAAFKLGLRTLDNFEAMLQATESGSWDWASVRSRCAEVTGAGPETTCYLADNADGLAIYSSDTGTKPIPSGLTDLPIAFNIMVDPAGGSDSYIGKIVTSEALQYGGSPEIRMTLAAASSCGATCMTQVENFGADIVVGGRYIADPSDTSCSTISNGTFQRVATPWLIPGFLGGTEIDATSGLRYRYECHDRTLPFGDDAAFHAKNLSFSASNPIPDGRSRARKLELVDGALINDSTLFIIFRESYASFLGAADTTGFSAYGYMILRRTTADLDPEAFVGAQQTANPEQPADVLGVYCDAPMLEEFLGSGSWDTATLNQAQLTDLTFGLINGVPGGFVGTSLPTPTEVVHYWCEDTGLIDGGPTGSTRCPEGSRIEFFTLDPTTHSSTFVAALPCQQEFSSSITTLPDNTKQENILSRANCWNENSDPQFRETILNWVDRGDYGARMSPAYRCLDDTGTVNDGVYCETNRDNPLVDKRFFAVSGAQPAFIRLRSAIDAAFRYKTRFRSRQGKTVGFAPSLCIPGSDQVPYCYDPLAIEESRRRIDCAAAIYVSRYDTLDPAAGGAQELLKNYLITNFSLESITDPATNEVTTYDGFERLLAELTIMMGDEAYTAAFASRFDLAGSSNQSFEGALFEPDGINLSGGAGFEMFNLYKATQYYQMALDRFFSLSPLIWESIRQQTTKSFITQNSVSTYFSRLIRASTQKARAWNEAARRYQDFNRPDLARFVIERAYTSTYLESIALSRVMLEVADITQASNVPQIRKKINDSALAYRSAMLEMRDRFRSISDSLTFFGFAPDYIPFPALDAGDPNAFEKLLASTRQKLNVAAAKEVIALASNRAYETDAALFQGELARIRNNYENQLAELCGTFTGDDGHVYPAIPKYAHLNERAQALGNPCGFIGNGEIFEALGNIEIVGLELKSVIRAYDNVLSEIEIERERVSSQCNLIVQLVDYETEIGGEVSNLQIAITTSQFIIDKARRIYDLVGKMAQSKKCIVVAGTAAGTDCPLALVATAEIGIAGAVLEGIAIVEDVVVIKLEEKISALKTGLAQWKTLQQCDVAMVDSNARTKILALRLKELQLEALKQSYRVRQAASRAGKLRNTAIRALAEQVETEQLAINIEAARNDPNVRIYKNDAVISADRTFWRTIREAYKLTKVYEYYTSQSYERFGNLFLVRMVQHGDISLESYIANLEDAFFTFEEQFGNPDLRVAILSLRDDVLQIPRIDLDGTALSEADRTQMLRTTLTDVSMLDENGYLTMQFATSLGQLSPLTRNHKVSYIEVEIIGSDVGDTLGRVYLRQRGTGIVRNVTDGKNYYAFPERTAVLNPFFNGTRVFTNAIYQNSRLQDRPFVNTHWELIFNQRDETVNQDVNLQSLSDMRLYVFYTDFTQL